MDIATIIGLIGGAALIVIAVLIGEGDFRLFLNLRGALIVLGGTLATSFIKFTMKDVINSFHVAMKAFTVKIDPPEKTIEDMVRYAKIAKKEGLIALENQTADDQFKQKALRYLADGYDSGLIKDMLNKDINLMLQRHAVGQKMFRGMGSAAPAFGMIGTLIGLVKMLSTMSDPDTIGPSMSIALLTTLYGALFANLVCIPIAEKLELRSEQEKGNKQIVIEAAISMSQGISPILIEETLNIFLSPRAQQENSTKEKSR